MAAALQRIGQRYDAPEQRIFEAALLREESRVPVHSEDDVEHLRGDDERDGARRKSERQQRAADQFDDAGRHREPGRQSKLRLEHRAGAVEPRPAEETEELLRAMRDEEKSGRQPHQRVGVDGDALGQGNELGSRGLIGNCHRGLRNGAGSARRSLSRG